MISGLKLFTQCLPEVFFRGIFFRPSGVTETLRVVYQTDEVLTDVIIDEYVSLL